MSGHIVYGLRCTGDAGVRYIGLTRRGLEYRLRVHYSHSLNRSTPLADWLNANHGKIEAFAIADCETDAHAKATEKVFIAFCHRLGLPLLNTAHIPGRRINQRRLPRKAALVLTRGSALAIAS